MIEFLLILDQNLFKNQVRSMVGCLHYLACNKWSVKNLKGFLL